MSGTTEKIPKFRETIPTEAIIGRIESGYSSYSSDLKRYFDNYPVFEVRRAILRHWLDKAIPVLAEDIDWIEQRIYNLKEEQMRVHFDATFWKDLLDWYVFNTDTDLVSRALEFAVKITQNDFGGSRGFFYRSDVLKIIAGRLERTPHIYENLKTPSLRVFLESFLSRKYPFEYDITDREFVDIRRVIRCAIAVRDWRFLPLIEQVHCRLRNQRRPKDYDFKKEIEIVEILAFLEEAVRLFKEKTKE